MMTGGSTAVTCGQQTITTGVALQYFLQFGYMDQVNTVFVLGCSIIGLDCVVCGSKPAAPSSICKISVDSSYVRWYSTLHLVHPEISLEVLSSIVQGIVQELSKKSIVQGIVQEILPRVWQSQFLVGRGAWPNLYASYLRYNITTMPWIYKA